MNFFDKVNHDWILRFKKPMIISGPCSAETLEQVLKTAHKLSKSYIQIFRAGIWKPRTKPGTFEGVGEIGLKWLQKVKEETGMMVATEVANATHVKYALAYNIDILWIGARSTVNPFLIQEMAEALKDTDKIILIKNPINPDLTLWVGSLERLIRQGIRNIGVIHRGFSMYNNPLYRNIPNWSIALNFIKRFPKIPILCDPSHICGQRKGLAKIGQQALNAHYDGLMIETHCDPDKAWSDAKQQITPENLLEFLKKIEIIKNNPKQELDLLRYQIDELDHHILSILSDRFDLTSKIGSLKKKYNLSYLQNNRWNQIITESKSYIKNLNLSNNFSYRFLYFLHKESFKRQKRDNITHLQSHIV